jgi:RimJ/RimL family protein N-acetyltransferase
MSLHQKSSEGAALHLRPVRFEDRGQIWQWANEPDVRAASFHTAGISWDEHCRWFAACLGGPRCIILVAEDESGNAVGQVRFELTDTGATVGISVDPRFRSRGFGSRILHEGLMVVSRERDVHTVDAYVKQDNMVSVRLFEGCGFVRAGSTTIRGFPAVHLVWNRKGDEQG